MSRTKQQFLRPETPTETPGSTPRALEVSAPATHADAGHRQKQSRLEKRAVLYSWIVNILLLAAKIVAFALTNSKAVLASLADSAVDLLSQIVISLSKRATLQHSDAYPVGRGKLECLGVIGCACIMILASVEVAEFSIIDIKHGIQGDGIKISFGLVAYLVLGIGTGLKLALYLYCRRVENELVGALAEDHLNDVMSNIVAIVTAAVAANVHKVWWLDPAGAIFISLVIVYRWAVMVYDQVRKIVGHKAPDEFIARIKAEASAHSSALVVDCVRAYHSGARYIVEVEVVMPETMTVGQSHDLSIELQHKIESDPQVERAYVHNDYIHREEPEHKVERELITAVRRRAQGRTEHQEHPEVVTPPTDTRV